MKKGIKKMLYWLGIAEKKANSIVFSSDLR
jgi:hypothetical protein